jgi:hypothetical protein
MDKDKTIQTLSQTTVSSSLSIKVESLKCIDASDIECYRANTGYVTIYYKDGRISRVKETFEQVDNFLNN